MDRREFLKNFAKPDTNKGILSGKDKSPEHPAPVKATAVRDNLLSLDRGWMEWELVGGREKSVDTFKSGNPDTEINGVAVGWMSYTGSIRHALGLGCNLFVTHEPTYYNHHDTDEIVDRFEAAAVKKKLIEESGLVVLRCHDLWDQYPGAGITHSWGDFLGLGKPADSFAWYNVYECQGKLSGEIARQVAEKTKILGQPGVQFIGPEDRAVNRLLIGTGAITPLLEFIENHGADMAICTDDGFTYWRDGAFAIDAGFPVAIVNHPVAEEAGMVRLAENLRRAFPTIPVHHIPQKCMYKIIEA